MPQIGEQEFFEAKSKQMYGRSIQWEAKNSAKRTGYSSVVEECSAISVHFGSTYWGENSRSRHAGHRSLEWLDRIKESKPSSVSLEFKPSNPTNMKWCTDQEQQI